jgi:uncharacterized protein with NRDE domain
VTSASVSCESILCPSLLALMMLNLKSTNVRDVAPAKPRISTPSRGLLLKSFLSPPPSSSLPTVRDYLTDYSASASEYEGFNLLLFKLPVQGDGKEPELLCLSNRPSPTLTDMRTSPSQGGLGVGIGRCHGLSNTPLSQPWPKVIEGERRMSESLRNWNQKDEGDKGLVERMMQILQCVWLVCRKSQC